MMQIRRNSLSSWYSQIHFKFVSNPLKTCFIYALNLFHICFKLISNSLQIDFKINFLSVLFLKIRINMIQKSFCAFQFVSNLL